MDRGSLGLFGTFILFLALLVSGRQVPPPAVTIPETMPGSWANTFSIAACDPEKNESGVSAASKYLAVGSAAPFPNAGIGAVPPPPSLHATDGSRELSLAS